MTFQFSMAVAIGLGLANFAYQGITAQDWYAAMDKTWVQFTACFAMYLAYRVFGEVLGLD